MGLLCLTIVLSHHSWLQVEVLVDCFLVCVFVYYLLCHCQKVLVAIVHYINIIYCHETLNRIISYAFFVLLSAFTAVLHFLWLGVLLALLSVSIHSLWFMFFQAFLHFYVFLLCLVSLAILCRFFDIGFFSFFGNLASPLFGDQSGELRNSIF